MINQLSESYSGSVEQGRAKGQEQGELSIETWPV